MSPNREKFEEWIKTESWMRDPIFKMEERLKVRHETLKDEYKDGPAQQAWEVWQAALLSVNIAP
jgi:hypothetical protein